MRNSNGLARIQWFKVIFCRETNLFIVSISRTLFLVSCLEAFILRFCHEVSCFSTSLFARFCRETGPLLSFFARVPANFAWLCVFATYLPIFAIVSSSFVKMVIFALVSSFSLENSWFLCPWMIFDRLPSSLRRHPCNRGLSLCGLI